MIHLLSLYPCVEQSDLNLEVLSDESISFDLLEQHSCHRLTTLPDHVFDELLLPAKVLSQRKPEFFLCKQLSKTVFVQGCLDLLE